jgi:uncharacterized protein
MAEKRHILVDAGPIVAAIDARDQWHRVAATKFRELSKPFYTCEAALSEACFLLGESQRAIDSVLTLVAEGVVVVNFALADNISFVQPLMKKYSNVPMSLADACLVRMSELMSDAALFTFDRDFGIYRRNRKERIPTIS